jgi:uncharacterized protein
VKQRRGGSGLNGVRLLPRDESFWEFFTSQTAFLTSAADLLRQAAQGGDSQLAAAAIEIKALERKSSQTLCDLHLRLHKTFITPIDPEDISLLSERLDRLLDELEAIAYRLSAYRLVPIPPLMSELSKRMHECAQLLERAFVLLSRDESADEPCGSILKMVEETDQLVREGVTELFANEKDPIAIMKKKEIYDLFERMSGSCQDLANALQNVSLKNS